MLHRFIAVFILVFVNNTVFSANAIEITEYEILFQKGDGVKFCTATIKISSPKGTYTLQSVKREDCLDFIEANKEDKGIDEHSRNADNIVSKFQHWLNQEEKGNFCHGFMARDSQGKCVGYTVIEAETNPERNSSIQLYTFVRPAYHEFGLVTIFNDVMRQHFVSQVLAITDKKGFGTSTTIRFIGYNLF